MENNNRDFHEKNLERVNYWLQFAEAKNAAIIAFIVAILAVIFSIEEQNDIILVIITTIYVAALVIAIISFYPKYKKNLAVFLYIKIFGLKNYVQFFDRQEDMYNFYENSHCFVCPSIAEAFGRVVTEAMYARRPVIIGSNIGAIDIIKDGVNGFVFEADKNKELNLALKIKEVYDKYDDLHDVADKAFELSKNCTWENFAKEIIENLYLKN